MRNLYSQFVAASFIGALAAAANAHAAVLAYDETVLLDNPYAYWRLGETGGTTAEEVTGADEGTYTGGYTLGQPDALVSAADTAIALNGSSGYVNTTTLGNFGNDIYHNGFTFEAWFRTDNTSQSMSLAGAGNATDSMVLSVALNASSTPGRIQLFIRNHASQIIQGYFDGLDVFDDEWHHLVLTTAPQAGTPVVSAYLDGVARGVTHAAQTHWVWQLNYQFPISLGAYNNAGTRNSFLDGGLDEVALYAAVLTADQVRAHYNASLVPEPGTAVLFGGMGVVLMALRKRLHRFA
jgi:hypothetical protein